MNDYLTTREVAAWLRIKPRKVYDLVAGNAIPVNRSTGKLLFPRAAIAAWIASDTEFGGARAAFRNRPDVIAGSHDPLLEWALRASGAGIAVYFDGSRDGLERLSRDEAIAAGSHIVNADGEGYNTDTVATLLADQPVVIVEWAKRTQGLVVPAGNPAGIKTFSDLAGRSVIPRQAGAGSQVLLESMLAADPKLAAKVALIHPPARSHADIAHAISTGLADAGLAIEAAARQYRLGFVPLAHERYDLVIWRRNYFEAPTQKLLAFARTDAFKARAEELGGYDVSGLGAVHYNGP